MRYAVGVVGLLLTLGGITACSPSPSEIRVTNASAVPVNLVFYKEGEPEPAGSLLAGESKTFRLATCSGPMTAIEPSSGHVVGTLDDACVGSWVISR